jgi:hypothetical protein
MAAPAAVPAMVDFIAFHDGDLLYRADTMAPEEKAKLPPIYELAWNHTTLRGLKIDPTITYLQTQYPDLAHVKWAIDTFGDEMPMHIEMTRFDGRVVFSGLPIVRYTSEERLEEIIKLHEENGCLVFNPHRYTLEEGGMKRTDRAQLQFKKEADPKGILNPGKMIAWDDPDFDFDSGRPGCSPASTRWAARPNEGSGRPRASGRNQLQPRAVPAVCETLRAKGDEVDALNLYDEEFPGGDEPLERLEYHDVPGNLTPLTKPYVDRLRAATRSSSSTRCGTTATRRSSRASSTASSCRASASC